MHRREAGISSVLCRRVQCWEGGRSCVGGGEDFSRTIGSRGMGVAVAFRSRSDSSSLVCLVCENPREVEEKSRNLTTSERDEEGKGVWVVRGYL